MEIFLVDKNVVASDLELNADELARLDEGFLRAVVGGTTSGRKQLAAIDIGAKEGTSSAGGHGLSPLPNAGANPE